MESVWDYPRPPRCEPTAKHIQVRLGEWVIADSSRTFRVLETSHPPVYYIPLADIRMDLLEATSRQTYCKFKGRASYWTLRARQTVLLNVAWSYQDPTPGFAAIKGYLAFYLEPLEGFVDGEKAQPQPGRFYGGWVTRDLAGPFKGGPGSWRW